jgi:hypothetical protein
MTKHLELKVTLTKVPADADVGNIIDTAHAAVDAALSADGYLGVQVSKFEEEAVE